MSLLIFVPAFLLLTPSLLAIAACMRSAQISRLEEHRIVVLPVEGE